MMSRLAYGMIFILSCLMAGTYATAPAQQHITPSQLQQTPQAKPA